jgi:hypothetical protein
MHPYYKKIILWFLLNTLSSSLFTYIVMWDVRQMLILTSGQSVIILSLYPPFEYYYTWTPEPPWCTITE